MNEQIEVSVIISTYNRCNLLPAALKSAIEQKTRGVNYEIIVVDNNSTDQTRQVIESFIERGEANLKYIFELEQGVSHARNTGIRNAQGKILAFFDDDVFVAPDWVAKIKDAFDSHPEVDCVGGKVLPQWEGKPPLWLTAEHWSPLALQDYGNQPFYVNSDRQLCLITANIAFRRELFNKIGGFSPKFQRVKDGIGSLEDHEFLLRFYQNGKQGLYEPGIEVTTLVPAERLSKSYHRRWHAGHGRFYAALREEEIERASARLFDVPAHLYREAAANVVNLIKYSVQNRQPEAFEKELRLRFFVEFFRSRRQEFFSSQQSPNLIGNLVSFARSLVSRKSNDKPIEKIKSISH